MSIFGLAPSFYSERHANSLQCLSCLNSSFTKTNSCLLSPLIQFLTIVSEQHIKLPTEGIKHSHDGFSEPPFEEPVIQGHTSSPPTSSHRALCAFKLGETATIFLLQSNCFALTVTYMGRMFLHTNTHTSSAPKPSKECGDLTHLPFEY